MNYIAYRVLENEYPNTPYKQFTNDLTNLFTRMRIGHFQYHYQEFQEYNEWISNKSWNRWYSMIRDMYQHDYSIFTLYKLYNTIHQPTTTITTTTTPTVPVSTTTSTTTFDRVNTTTRTTTRIINTIHNTTDITTITSTNVPFRWGLLEQTMIYSIACAIASADHNTLESVSILLRKKYLDSARYKYSFFRIRSWFHKIQEYIVKNPFQTSSDYETLMDIVSKVYRTRLGLKRFIRVWKWKHSCKNMVTTTLDLEPFESLSSKRLIELMEQNSRYMFDCLELSKLWVQGLLNHDEFFSEPKDLMNPYTNIKFSTSNLWNIYIHLQHYGFRVHPVIDMFVSCSMNISLFELRYEGVLRSYRIDQYIRDLRTVLYKPVAKLTSTEKYMLTEEYTTLLNRIHDLTTDYEAFEVFYYESMVVYEYDSIQAILKDCILIIENYYRKWYSYNPTEKHKSWIQCKKNIFAYLKDKNNYFNRWYVKEYGVNTE